MRNTTHLPDTLPYLLTFKGVETYVYIIHYVQGIVETLMASFVRSVSVAVLFY